MHIGGLMQNRLNNLIERGTKLNTLMLNLQKPYTERRFFEKIETLLGLVIPEDIKKLSEQIVYSILGGFEFFDTKSEENDWNSIIKNNLELRKEYAEQSGGKSDMSRILVLADDDGGSVFMITQDSPEKPTPVIWCDATDMYWYSIDGKFRSSHDEWPSFTDFFEYLVEEEEKKLQEDMGR